MSASKRTQRAMAKGLLSLAIASGVIVIIPALTAAASAECPSVTVQISGETCTGPVQVTPTDPASLLVGGNEPAPTQPSDEQPSGSVVPFNPAPRVLSPPPSAPRPANSTPAPARPKPAAPTTVAPVLPQDLRWEGIEEFYQGSFKPTLPYFGLSVGPPSVERPSTIITLTPSSGGFSLSLFERSLAAPLAGSILLLIGAMRVRRFLLDV